jgi:hypothetical protein
MKLQRIIIETYDIDIEEERQRIVKADYTAAQRKRLLKLMNLFEQGKFKEAHDFTSTWGRTKEEYPEIEHIHNDVWRIIGGASVGIEYKIL